MVDIFTVTIPRLTGEEERTAYVYVPDHVRDHSDERCAVLYMFDGQNLFFDETASFGKSWGLKDYLDRHEIPLIVASVACNFHPETYPLGGRFSEYSPFSFHLEQLDIDIKGRGKITMDWLTNEFKTLIDERYPTLPDRKHTFIAGSSMGGLMTLYALTNYNHYFSRGAALSPAMYFSSKENMEMLKQAEMAPDTVLYMDYGEKELPLFGSDKLFRDAVYLLQEKNILLESRIVPNGEHNERSWEKQLPFIMNTLFYEL